jgi:hypothetical protein
MLNNYKINVYLDDQTKEIEPLTENTNNLNIPADELPLFLNLLSAEYQESIDIMAELVEVIGKYKATQDNGVMAENIVILRDFPEQPDDFFIRVEVEKLEDYDGTFEIMVKDPDPLLYLYIMSYTINMLEAELAKEKTINPELDKRIYDA